MNEEVGVRGHDRGSRQRAGLLGRDVKGWAALDGPLFGQQPKISSCASNKGGERHGRVHWPPARLAAPGTAVVEVELIEYLHVHERLQEPPPQPAARSDN